jgi:hypothetical protein
MPSVDNSAYLSIVVPVFFNFVARGIDGKTGVE